MIVLGVIGFAIAMTTRYGLASIYMRFLLAAVGGGFQIIAYVYAPRRQIYQSTARHRVMMVLGVTAFAVVMTAHDELSSINMRALVAGLAGGFLGIAMFGASRRLDLAANEAQVHPPRKART